MRRINKFKLFKNIRRPLIKFPVKVLRFYKSKWNRVKSNLQRYLKFEKKYYNPLIRNTESKIISKLKSSYRERLNLKKEIFCIYDDSSKDVRIGNIKKKKDVIDILILRSLYRIDTLLWYLNLSSSIYDCRQQIFAGNISVNGFVIKKNIFLKKGDFIDLKHLSSSDVEEIRKKYLDSLTFLTFIEIDFYTKTIVIIKDLNELSLEDYVLLIDNYIDMYKLI